MRGAKALSYVAVACWGLVVSSAPNGSRAAVLPAHSLSDQEQLADTPRYGHHGGLLHKTQGQGVSIIVDDVTGIRVGIPFGIVGAPTLTKNGRNWKASDNRLNIDTLRFVDRSLDGLATTLRRVRGRSISRSSPVTDGFILEGTDDRGKTSFYVEARSRGGEIRGLSIVYATRFRGELNVVIEAIKKSFDPFPTVSTPPPPPPPVVTLSPDTSSEELKRQLAEAAELLKAAKRREEDATRQAEEAKRRADDANRLADEARTREDEARRQAEAERAKREKEREEAIWRQQVREEERAKAQKELEALIKRFAGKAEPKMKADAGSFDPCRSQTVCTQVPVFFGTDRKRADLPQRIGFGPQRSSTLQLGSAIVTVPRTSNRKVGEIPRPTKLERFLGAPPEGTPAKHFTIPANGVLVFANADEFIAAVRAQMEDAGEFRDHAFVFVHGYWTTFEDALYRVAQIAYDLAGPDGRPFGTAFLYSWPSGGGFRDYVYDVESAQFSVEHLRKYVDLVLERSGAKHVHMIAHSMGNRPLLAALEEIARTPNKPATINQVILAAPDFDAEQFARIAQRIVPMAKGVTLYASANDLAMKAAKEAYRGMARAGDVTKGGPITVAGVDTIDISAISTEVIGWGHAEYIERRELLNDIALLLRLGIRPPDKRTPMFRAITSEQGTFWRLQR